MRRSRSQRSHNWLRSFPNGKNSRCGPAENLRQRFQDILLDCALRPNIRVFVFSKNLPLTPLPGDLGLNRFL
jgi:hypothetical protein